MDLIRMMASRQTIDNIRDGTAPQIACEKFIKHLGDKLSGLGGVICLNKIGEVGLAFNTPRMAFAYKTTTSNMVVGIEPTDIKKELSSIIN